MDESETMTQRRTERTAQRTTETTGEDKAQHDGDGVPVFDPSKNPEDFGGAPEGVFPGEQAGDPTPQGDLAGRRR